MPELSSAYMSVRRAETYAGRPVWSITNRKSGEELCKVGWYAPWRQFTMSPTPSQSVIFSHDCLAAIAGFIRDANAEDKTARGQWA